MRYFKALNDAHIQYCRWLCVENCIQPEYQWTRQVKEKYELTSFLKVYGGGTPGHHGEQVRIKIKSPRPQGGALGLLLIPSPIHAKPGKVSAPPKKTHPPHPASRLH